MPEPRSALGTPVPGTSAQERAPRWVHLLPPRVPRPSGRWRSLGFLLVALAGACSSPPTDETPSGALRLFLDAIWSSETHDSDDDEATLTVAYELLDADTRARLARDARLAGALGGREREPWEMLAGGASRMMIVPRRAGGMRETIDADGRGATVSLSGEDGSVAEIRLVLEENGWRVLLEPLADDE